MNKYKIKFEKKYIKHLEKIPKKFRDKIKNNVYDLSSNPRPNGCKKLKGPYKEPLYRIRNGNYRIIYSIKDDILLILVVEVDHRKDVYR